MESESFAVKKLLIWQREGFREKGKIIRLWCHREEYQKKA